VHALYVMIGAFFSAVILGRLAYVIFCEFRAAFPWIFGDAADSRADQIRMLTACMAATLGICVLDELSGYSPVCSILAMPFVFTWAWEMLHLSNRVVGPVLERLVVDWHPVDYAYALIKTSMIAAWNRQRERSRQVERLAGPKPELLEEAPGPLATREDQDA
jgi:hypothetical protein